MHNSTTSVQSIFIHFLPKTRTGSLRALPEDPFRDFVDVLPYKLRSAASVHLRTHLASIFNRPLSLGTRRRSSIMGLVARVAAYGINLRDERQRRGPDSPASIDRVTTTHFAIVRCLSLFPAGAKGRNRNSGHCRGDRAKSERISVRLVGSIASRMFRPSANTPLPWFPCQCQNLNLPVSANPFGPAPDKRGTGRQLY